VYTGGRAMETELPSPLDQWAPVNGDAIRQIDIKTSIIVKKVN